MCLKLLCEKVLIWKNMKTPPATLNLEDLAKLRHRSEFNPTIDEVSLSKKI